MLDIQEKKPERERLRQNLAINTTPSDANHNREGTQNPVFAPLPEEQKF